MKLEELMKVLKTKRRGTYFTIVYSRPVGIKKAYADKYYVTKTVRATIRTGIQYTHTKRYKEKMIEQYKREFAGFTPNAKELNQYIQVRTQPLPFGEWEAPNTIIKHTNKEGELKYYLRCYSSINKSNITYTINGRPTTKEELIKMGILLAKEYQVKADEGCYTLNIESIQKIF